MSSQQLSLLPNSSLATTGISKQDCYSSLATTGVSKQDCYSSLATTGVSKQDCYSSLATTGVSKQDCYSSLATTGVSKQDCYSSLATTGVSKQDCYIHLMVCAELLIQCTRPLADSIFRSCLTLSLSPPTLLPLLLCLTYLVPLSTIHVWHLLIYPVVWLTIGAPL